MIPQPFGSESSAADGGHDAAVDAPRSSSTVATWATLAGAVVLVGVVTVVQGMWTERWGGKDVAASLKESGKILEEAFPSQFGDWTFDRELESNPKELERAGAVGHVAKLYRNTRTKAQVSAFVVCATPHDASGHTPDRCYPGAGFEIGESEHRHSLPLRDGRKAETFTGTFRKQGQTLRVFWTYGVDGKWIAPQIARIELAGSTAVYKMYAIIDETRIKGTQATLDCNDFLGALLPALDTAVAAAREKAAAETAGPAAERAPDPTPAAQG